MTSSFRPTARLQGFTPYKPRRPAGAPVVHKVDANEASVDAEGLDRYTAELNPEVLNRYTRPHELEADLAGRFGVTADRVAVTAGADDGLMRQCLLTLETGRRALMTRPTFEMIPRYVTLSGGTIDEVDWLGGSVPTEALVQAVRPETSIVFLVTPSSPAGEVATEDTVRRLSQACAEVGALLVVDQAYVEFADVDLTDLALTLPNAIVARTFSKAWGLAGLRVGYFLGPQEVIEWMKTVGQPYAVATPSVAMAKAALVRGESKMRARVAQVRHERERLHTALAASGWAPVPSHGNSVLVRFGERGAAFVNAMAARGIAVRLFQGPSLVEGAVRITCPGDEAAYGALSHALREALGEVGA
ncbi:MAG: aminotransferase class I/II-fold pyridoxal phosphate-dependent enzyme [Myxococcota bacterium]